MISVASFAWYSSIVRADLAEPPIEDSSKSSPPKDVETTSNTSPFLSNMLSKLDTKHEELSSDLANMARRIDAFFGDDRAYEESNKTHGQVTLEATRPEAENVQFDLRVRAKIQLPRTQQKLRLLIESDAPELGEDPTVSNSLVNAVEDTQLSLAVETLLPVVREWNISPALGIKADWLPDPYARIRATRYFDIAPWLSRLSTNASWYAIAGPITNVRLDFDRHLDPDWLFRATTSLKWVKDGDPAENTDASETFTYFQRLRNRRSAAYSLGVNTNSSSHWAIQSYVIGAAYRREIHKDWMFVDINPFVEFSREGNWHDSVGITLRLDTFFGP
jgi:hypothetical protein